jgi:hypothetical protein
MELAGGCHYFSKALVRPRRGRSPLCICVVFAFLCRAQPPSDVRPSAVVVAGGSKDGSDGAGRKNEPGGEPLRAESGVVTAIRITAIGRARSSLQASSSIARSEPPRFDSLWL